MKKITVIIFFISSLGWADAYDPTNDLMFAFGSRCKGKGPINNTAIQDGAGLKYIAESIKDDSACKGITGALSDIDSLNIPSLLDERNYETDLEYMSMQSKDLEMAIAAEMATTNPDMDYVTALKAELVSAKINIAKSQKMSNQERTRKRLSTINNFSKYTNILFARIKQSDQCFAKNPNLPAQLGAQILGLGSTFGSGIVGSLMLGMGNLIDNFISFFRDRSLGKKIEAIESHRLGEAVGCSLEGLSYTYCQARDVQTILDATKNKLGDNSKKPSWMIGIGVIGQDVQSYLDWITKVDAGSPAGTVGRASDKKSAFSMQNELRAVKIDLEGILNTAKNTVARSTNKTDATKKALNDLAAKMLPKYDPMSGTSSSGVFSNLFTGDPSCGPYIYLYSKGVDKERAVGSDASEQCSTYVSRKYGGALPNIDTEVGPLLENLVSEATQQVNIQLSQVNESNADLVMVGPDSRTQNRRSAREFLNSAVAYLDTLLNDPNSIAKKQNQKNLIEKTKKQITNALTIIDRTEDIIETSTPDPNDPTKVIVTQTTQPADIPKKLADLSKELIPQGDTFAIPKALSEIINQDIDQKISAGQIDENLSALMQLSATDSLSELIENYIGLEPAKSQARSARDNSKNNLTSLASLFGSSIEERMAKLSRTAKDDVDDDESLALLCMQSIAVPEAPKIGTLDIGKYCAGKTYQSIYENSGIKMDYNELSKKPFPERACAVYDFYRKSHLYGLKNTREKSRIRANDHR